VIVLPTLRTGPAAGLACCVAALAMPGRAPQLRAHEPDPAAVPLVFGMSTALSGPAGDLGQEMKLGVELSFVEANEQGGVGGRPLRLVVYDDGYEPARAVPNMLRLIDEDGVLAVVGNVGTPTAIAAAPIARERGTLFLGAFTGANVLRRFPPERFVINFRASYAEETAAIVDYLLRARGLRLDQIALFTQRDSYGDAGYAEALAALKRHGLRSESSLLHVRYTRNTLDVEGALARLIDAPGEPRAVIMFGAYGPCAKLIRLACQHDFAPVFASVSFVGARSLAEALGEQGDGVIVTQVVPHPDSDLPVVRDYRAALRRHHGRAAPSHTSLEGYIVGRILLEALGRLETSVSRSALIAAFESMQDVDIGLGFPISFSSGVHQASSRVWATVIGNGRVVPLDWEQQP